jgi:hypothetical protein
MRVGTLGKPAREWLATQPNDYPGDMLAFLVDRLSLHPWTDPGRLDELQQRYASRLRLPPDVRQQSEHRRDASGKKNVRSGRFEQPSANAASTAALALLLEKLLLSRLAGDALKAVVDFERQHRQRGGIDAAALVAIRIVGRPASTVAPHALHL